MSGRDDLSDEKDLRITMIKMPGASVLGGTKMSEFRHLPRDQEYSCRECSKTDLGNYFVSPTLCKKREAKRRVPIARVAPTVIEHEPGQPAMTNYVKKATSKTSGKRIDSAASRIHCPSHAIRRNCLQRLIYRHVYRSGLYDGYFREYMVSWATFFPAGLGRLHRRRYQVLLGPRESTEKSDGGTSSAMECAGRR